MKPSLFLMAAALMTLGACTTSTTATTHTPDSGKDHPYTYITPPEPQGDEAKGAKEDYVPSNRDPSATPFPQW